MKKRSALARSSRPVVPEQRAKPVALSRLLAEWVADDVISAEQAAQIRARQSDTDVVSDASTVRARGSGAVEALGYLGALIVTAAVVLLVGRYWDQLPDGGRFGLLLAASGALLVAGFAIPPRTGRVAIRLRSALWLGATLAFAAAAGVAGDAYLELTVNDDMILVAGSSALLAGLLWGLHPTVVQESAMMLALAGTTAAVLWDATESGNVPGLGVWLAGVLWFALGSAGVVRFRRPAPTLAIATAVVGALTTAGTDAGLMLAFAVALAALWHAMRVQDLPSFGVAALGLLIALLIGVLRWFPDSLVVALVLMAAGVILVSLAVRLSRRRQAHG